MYFLYPQFLWALGLLSIPIIIHFFNFRRYKKIYFSNVRIIKQVTQEHQVKNKLKEYIILIERLLAITFLVFAFAQPFKTKNTSHLLSKNNSDVVIYIDNSFSMENVSTEGKLLDVAISKAKEIIQSFSKSSKFIILTNDVNYFNKKSLSQNEAIEELSKVKINHFSLSLSTLLNRIQTLHLNQPLVFILSDAQKKFTDIQNIKPDFPIFYFLLSPTQKNNISIDSVWIDNPVVLSNVPQQLHIKITNHNSENANDIPVKLIQNNIQTSILNVSIPAHQSIETTTSFIPDNKPFQFSKVFINDYPVTFDDELFFSINTDIHIKAQLINGSKNPESSKYIRAFFNNDSIFVFSEQQENQVNYSELSNQDVIVLNEMTAFTTGLEEQLKILAQKGKTIIIIPYIDNPLFVLPSEIQSYQWTIDTTSQTISNNVLKHPLIASAFEKTNNTYKMPVVKEYLKTQQLNFEPIVELNNNAPLLFKYEKNNYYYFVFTSTIQSKKNQIAMHSIFVPLMYQLSFTAIPAIPLYYYCGSNQNIFIPNIQLNSDNAPKLIEAYSSSTNTFQIIPSFFTQGNSSYIKIPMQSDIKQGHYYLQIKDENKFALSFNYNRSESDMQFYSDEELSDILQKYQIKNFAVNNITSVSAKKIIQTEISGTPYWKLCVILALIFFVAESLTIRFMK
ncbi:MAG TPA: BatA domain-containing protein [Bacteroidia bacterium]|nr:BatA domain-containing protein [Bacteroidia bacterium]